MDPKRFDNWTRSRALRFSRRDALRLAATGGASMALAAHLPNTAAQAACTLTVHAETAGGPSAPAAYDGALQFTLGSDGAFSQATFALSSSGSLPVTGLATGRAIELQISLSTGQALVLSGASELPIAMCQGAAAGILAGPQPGDLGAWRATAAGSAPAGPPPSGQTSSGTTSGSGSGAGGGNCLELQSQCTASGQCCSGWCTDNECRTCSDTICGEDCAVLSDNLAHCGACFNPCDVDTETCVDGVCTAGDGGGGATCLPDGAPCVSSTDCCARACSLSSRICGCAQLGQSCSDDDVYCCEGTPVVCFGACCILDGFPCSADADCCDYIQARGFCTNGICTRNA